MKIIRQILLLTGLVVFGLCGCSKKKPPDNECVLARVNTSVLTCDEGRALLDQYPPGSTTLAKVVSLWVDEELLYLTGLKNEFHEDTRLLSTVKQFRRFQIGDAYLSMALAQGQSVTRDNVRRYYKTHLPDFIRDSQEARVYHFFLQDKNVAHQVKKILKSSSSGEKRKELFSSYVVDVLTVKKGQLVSSLDNAIFKTRSRVLGPIKTEYGFHVVEVLERLKKGSQVGLEEVYDEIYQRLLNQQFAQNKVAILDSLRSKTFIKINLENVQ